MEVFFLVPLDRVGSHIKEEKKREVARSQFIEFNNNWAIFNWPRLPCPTGLFTISEPQNLEIGELCVFQERRAADLKAPKL